MKSSFFLIASICVTLAITQSAQAAELANNVAVKVDIDSGGTAYNPILCQKEKECGCDVGFAECSICPDDKGSSNQRNNVCWCAGDGVGTNGIECNPSKNGGPYKVDVDDGGNQYVPIQCEHENNRCVCSVGNAECGKCPFDKGSQYQHDDVCWCNTYPTGECNPDKDGGPSME